ncbi:retrovirus-related Pol polyprotein from transposon 17.6 [Nephila pilipes]|uniref:Retrovirus-related Pol polyprotein from transposon 17.6 n=1 Tax=Nephila pilipes TaxID=299642 RepID=A0A8X6N3T4_NEPPI|nr:retrovirus-related Pol polyprotein from transposon 17.6 [Nephila pilipes]
MSDKSEHQNLEQLTTTHDASTPQKTSLLENQMLTDVSQNLIPVKRYQTAVLFQNQILKQQYPFKTKTQLFSMIQYIIFRHWRTVIHILQFSDQYPENIMHVPVTLVKTQFIAFCDTGPKATIINEKTFRIIGSPPLYPSQVTFAGIGRDKVKSIGFFQNSITIQDISLSTNIHVVNNNLIPLDAIVGMDCLRQT